MNNQLHPVLYHRTLKNDIHIYKTGPPPRMKPIENYGQNDSNMIGGVAIIIIIGLIIYNSQ